MGDDVNHVEICVKAAILSQAQMLVVGWDAFQKLITNEKLVYAHLLNMEEEDNLRGTLHISTWPKLALVPPALPPWKPYCLM